MFNIKHVGIILEAKKSDGKEVKILLLCNFSLSEILISKKGKKIVITIQFSVQSISIKHRIIIYNQYKLQVLMHRN